MFKLKEAPTEFIVSGIDVETSGASLTALTVKLNVLAVESTVPSLTLKVIVAVPLQLAAGVNVSVEPETLGTTFEVDEVARKVWESPVSASVSDKVTVLVVSSFVV